VIRPANPPDDPTTTTKPKPPKDLHPQFLTIVPQAGRGHQVRKQRGTSALRDQEIGGKFALSKNPTPAMLLVLGIGRRPLFRYRLPAV
jgi:hypothetical protein